MIVPKSAEGAPKNEGLSCGIYPSSGLAGSGLWGRGYVNANAHPNRRAGDGDSGSHTNPNTEGHPHPSSCSNGNNRFYTNTRSTYGPPCPGGTRHANDYSTADPCSYVNSRGCGSHPQSYCGRRPNSNGHSSRAHPCSIPHHRSSSGPQPNCSAHSHSRANAEAYSNAHSRADTNA